MISRKRLFSLHGWLGLHLGTLLFAICFSGTIAVFTPEIDAWLDPIRHTPPPYPEAAKADLSKTYQALRESRPEASIRYIYRSLKPNAPDTATIQYGSQDFRRVFIDPYRQRVTGERPSLDLKSFVRIFHKQFYLVPTTVGLHGTFIVGAFGIVLLGSVLTGIFAFKNWIRTLFTLRIRARRRLFFSDLHRFLGAWALLVTLVIALTGIWYLLEKVSEEAGILEHDPAAPRLSSERMAAHDLKLQHLPLEELLHKARQAYPELEPLGIFFPNRADATLSIVGQAEALSVRDRANNLVLDPYSGEVLHLQRGVELGLLQRATHTMDPVHFGTFGGPVTRWIWFLSGLALSAGILIGAYLYILRTSKKPKNEQKPGKRYLWSLSGLLSSIVLLASMFSFAMYSKDSILLPPSFNNTSYVADYQFEDLLASLHLEGQAKDGQQRISLRFQHGEYPNVQEISFRYSNEEESKQVLAQTFGGRYAGEVSLQDGREFQISKLAIELIVSDEEPPIKPTSFEARMPELIKTPPKQPMQRATQAGIGIFALMLFLPCIGWLIFMKHPTKSR